MGIMSVKLFNTKQKIGMYNLFRNLFEKKMKEHFVTTKLSKIDRDHSFKTSPCLRGGGVFPCADGPKVTVHKDQKSPS